MHSDIYDKFVARAAERAKQITTGAGLTSGAAQGPQVDQASVDKIERLVGSGKAQGARLVVGGSKVDGPGYFFQPTVFADVGDDMEIAREEIFGPVMCILRFTSTEEVIARANDTCYGLAGAVFSKDIETVTTVAMGLRCGTVWANCYDILEASVPFGGYKQSGAGRELGEYGLAQYHEVRRKKKTPR